MVKDKILELNTIRCKKVINNMTLWTPHEIVTILY